VRQAIASRVFETRRCRVREEDDTAIGFILRIPRQTAVGRPTRQCRRQPSLLTGARVDLGRIFYGCWRSFGDLDSKLTVTVSGDSRRRYRRPGILRFADDIFAGLHGVQRTHLHVDFEISGIDIQLSSG